MHIGVIYDMDGVLVDSGAAHQESWRLLAAENELEVTPERFASLFGRPSRDIIRILWGDRISEDKIRLLDQQKEVIYRDLIRGHIPFKTGCRQALERLHTAGLRLAVATSGPPENLEMVISDGLIANYFDAEVHGFSVDHGKPAPDCFLLAAQRLDLPPTACVVVEDAPVGIEAAKAAGMPVIGLAGTHPAEVLKQAGAVVVVGSLLEITPDLVRTVHGRAAGCGAAACCSAPPGRSRA